MHLRHSETTRADSENPFPFLLSWNLSNMLQPKNENYITFVSTCFLRSFWGSISSIQWKIRIFFHYFSFISMWYNVFKRTAYLQHEIQIPHLLEFFRRNNDKASQNIDLLSQNIDFASQKVKNLLKNNYFVNSLYFTVQYLRRRLLVVCHYY